MSWESKSYNLRIYWVENLFERGIIKDFSCTEEGILLFGYSGHCFIPYSQIETYYVNSSKALIIYLNGEFNYFNELEVILEEISLEEMWERKAEEEEKLKEYRGK